MIYTAVTENFQTTPIQIDASYAKGFSGVKLLGNMSHVCQSSSERACAALERCQIQMPSSRILASFSPGETRIDGSHIDLALAVTLAGLIGGQKIEERGKWLFASELGLGGELKPVRAVVAYALAAMEKGFAGIVVAKENLREIQILKSLKEQLSFQCFAFDNLKDVLDWYFGEDEIFYDQDENLFSVEDHPHSLVDFDDMELSPILEEIACVSATGMHSLLLTGAPGSGKSMFAGRLPSVMPKLSSEEHIHALAFYSAFLDKVPEALLTGVPPFRSPHHYCSTSAILGCPEHPGEISLAHGGVLFLDEFPEFRRDILEALREPLEGGQIHISRARHKTNRRAHMILVAAANPCACGWYGSARRMCSCGGGKLVKYQGKLSGPILDRIDIHFKMPECGSVQDRLLNKEKRVKRTDRMKASVEKARTFAQKRNEALGFVVNAQAPQGCFEDFLKINAEEKPMIGKKLDQIMTSRGVTRCLRVARTIADLEAREMVRLCDVEQAIKWLPTFESYQSPQNLYKKN